MNNDIKSLIDSLKNKRNQTDIRSFLVLLKDELNAIGIELHISTMCEDNCSGPSVEYIGSIDLDMSKYDAKKNAIIEDYKNNVNLLNKEIEKVTKERNELKDEFMKLKETKILPDKPIEIAAYIIDKYTTENKQEKNNLRQIAEHLLVYCGDITKERNERFGIKTCQ